jgi:hypothetical protein
MAVWDLNSNLDVFGMQTFLRGLFLYQVTDWFPKLRFILSVLSTLESKTSKLFHNEKVKHGKARTRP